MNIYEALTKEDKEKILAYLEMNEIQPDSKFETEEEYLSTILQYWAKNKQTLYEAFGEKLIISKNFLYQKPYAELYSEMSHKVSDYKFIKDYYSFWNKRDRMCQYPYCLRENLYALAYPETLAHNAFNPYTPIFDEQEADLKLTLPSGKVLDFKSYKNAKPLRILATLNKEFQISSEEAFEEFRLFHSMVHNQKKVSGVLNLSIHPLDYMTMSDNCENWSSCMSWLQNGEFRSGTIEMMNSPCVVVAYISSDKNHLEIAPDLTWNSKKWRQLFIVDKNAIASIKAYPYRNDELAQMVIEWIKDIVPYSYTNDLYNFGNGCPIKGTYINFYADGHMYCDFSSSLNHWGYFSKEVFELPRFYLDYSGELNCMECGELVDLDETLEGSLVCDRCDENASVYYCEDCGRRLSRGERYYNNYGSCYCEDCIPYHEYKDCSACREEHCVADLEEHYICYKDKEYLLKLCPECYSTLLKLFPEDDYELKVETEEQEEFIRALGL